MGTRSRLKVGQEYLIRERRGIYSRVLLKSFMNSFMSDDRMGPSHFLVSFNFVGPGTEDMADIIYVASEGWANENLREPPVDSVIGPLRPLEGWEDECCIPAAEFREQVMVGFFTDEDGHGFYGTKTHRSEVEVDLGNVSPPAGMTHVVWYNK